VRFALRRRERQTVQMEPGEFAEFYERYRKQCIGAGLEPLTPAALQARMAEWQALGLRRDMEPPTMMQLGSGRNPSPKLLAQRSPNSERRAQFEGGDAALASSQERPLNAPR